MNGILNTSDCTIRVEKFTEEERKEYDKFEAGRPQRNYLAAYNGITWPADMESSERRMEWLKTHDADAYEYLKMRRELIESSAMIDYRSKHSTPDGTYFVCLDEVVQGPFPTEEEMEKALFYTIPIHHPAMPYKMYFQDGIGKEL
jgi:hypothetical protein